MSDVVDELAAAQEAGELSEAAAGAEPLLVVDELRTHFPIRAGLLRRQVGTVYALDGVSFTVDTNQTLGIVGESGCGKTTLGRSILRLIEPTSGSVRFRGHEVTTMSGGELRKLRKEMQVVFQDPYSSLNSRLAGQRHHQRAVGGARRQPQGRQRQGR